MGIDIIQRNNFMELSNDKKQLLLLIQPIDDDISAEKLTQLFLTSEYSDLKLNVQAVNQAAHVLQQLNSGQTITLKSIVIADRVDAQLSITIDPIMMQVKAQIISAYGGTAISSEKLQEKIAALGIKHGIRQQAAALLIEKSQSAKPGTSVQVTIAQGTAVVNGTDASFKRLVETPKERLLKPTQSENGRVDMRNLGKLITVQLGSHLMRKTPYSEGSTGLNVMGDIIEHVQGKDFSLVVGKNTAISDTDKNLLIATLTGIPKMIDKGKGMQVDDVLLIRDVDVGYGHVSYDGSIIIEGNVCDGMKVQSTGDITVSGFIESAEIDCGGDLIVGQGILGRNIEENAHNFSCQINAKGSVIANFSQYSKINAGGNVHIKKQLLHCYVESSGDIKVGDDEGLKGTILGGFLRSNKGINTVTLGATAGSKTIIDLVGLYPKIITDRQLIKQSIVEEQSKLENLIAAQRKIDQLPESEKKHVLDTRLQLTKETAKKLISSLSVELENKNMELQQYFEEAKVISQKALHNDVVVSVGRDTFRTQRNYGPTQISVKNYKLSIDPYLK